WSGRGSRLLISCCWTKPPRRWIPPSTFSCVGRWTGSPPDAPPSPSPIASPPPSRPTRWWCSTPVGSSSVAPTRSWWRRAGCTPPSSTTGFRAPRPSRGQEIDPRYTAGGMPETPDIAAAGRNDWLIEEMYERYLDSPPSVSEPWRRYFENGAVESGGVPPAEAPTAPVRREPEKGEAPAPGTETPEGESEGQGAGQTGAAPVPENAAALKGIL